jgi:DNA invertase Pin-like site-specific DNA recombinase
VSKDRRPALDEVLRDVKRRRFDILVCWRLDRLGTVAHLSLNEAALALSVSRSTLKRWRRGQKTRSPAA